MSAPAPKSKTVDLDRTQVAARMRERFSVARMTADYVTLYRTAINTSGRLT